MMAGWWGPTPPSLPELAKELLEDADLDAAVMLAERLLGANVPPKDFREFVGRIPGLTGRMTRPIFDVLCDAYDAVRQEQIVGALEKQFPTKEAA